MKVLFLHRYVPAQYRHLAAALARDPANAVHFVAAEGERAAELPGVRRHAYRPTREPGRNTHHYLQSTEASVLHGQAAFRAMRALARDGFRPDVICAHAGFGTGLFAADAFPQVPIVGYFEWFYRSRDSDADFLDPGAVDDDDACRLRVRNAGILIELAAAARAVCPTQFQCDQFPEPWRGRMTVLHDGVDTDYFAPADARPPLDLPIPSGAPIVTYGTRGLEPYRGFPQFMRAAAMVLQRRPDVHAVVMGEDRVFYGRRPPGGGSWRTALLDELAGIDRTRLHFTGPLPITAYRDVLRASSAHVYLTVPFVLSWSLLEAMATGCAVVASDTAPVREVIGDGGMLADFFAPAAIAECIEAALAGGPRVDAMRRAAREAVLARYALASLLPRHIDLVAATADRG